MRKVFKYLAVILALTLIVGIVPVQAATGVSLKKTSRTLFIDGCTGKKADGTAAKFYSYMNVKKFINGFDENKMTVKLETEDKTIASVNNKKVRINAKGLGKTVVRVTVTDKTTKEIKMQKSIAVTVKKNATAAELKCTGADDKNVTVGDSITVEIPAGTVDTDKRRLVASDKSVVITNKGTKYTAEFTKAGTFKMSVEAYQSASYPGATVTKSFTVTAVGEKDEPTPTPTATPTPTPTGVPAAGEVKQTALNAVEITFAGELKDAKKADFKLYYLVGKTEIPFSTIKDVKVNGNKATVEAYSNFTAGQEYFVKYGETEVSFKALEIKKEMINRIEVGTTKALVNTSVDLKLRYFINDIDVTDEFASQLAPTFSFSPENVAFAMGGNNIYFTEANKSVVVKVKVLIGNKPVTYDPIYVEGAGQVTSYETTFTQMIYTITTDDGIYMTKTDKLNNTFTVDDSTAVFEALFLYSDGSVKTMAQEGITAIRSEDNRVFMIGAPAASGGYTLIPNTEGTNVISLIKDGKTVQAIPVVVKGARKPATVDAKVSKPSLNIHGGVDSLTITAKVYDQYGNELKGQPITITQTDATKNAFGRASFGGFSYDGELLVKGSDIVLNPNVTTGTIAAVVECAGIKKDVTFTVADASTPIAWRLGCTKSDSSIILENGILPGTDAPEKVSFYIEGFNNNVFVQRENIAGILDKAPSPAYFNTAYGLAANEKKYFVTIQKNGSFITSGDCINVSGNNIEFAEFASGKKLEAASYVITGYCIVGGTNNVPTVTNLGARTVVCKDTQIKPVITLIKDKTTKSDKLDITVECFKASFNGTELPASAFSAVDLNVDGTGSTFFFKTITVTVNNTTFGDLNLTVPVHQTITK